MRKVLTWLAEPVAVLGIVLALAWAAHSLVSPVRVAGGSMAPALQPGGPGSDHSFERRGEWRQCERSRGRGRRFRSKSHCFRQRRGCNGD